MDLVNKPTTHTFVEEAKVYKLFHHVALQVGCALNAFGLRKLHHRVQDALHRAEAVFASAASVHVASTETSNKAIAQRTLCS